MANSAWEVMTHPDDAHQFAAIVAVRPFAESRKEAKAIVAVAMRVAKKIKPTEASAMMTEAKSGTPGPTMTAYATACATAAALYGLPEALPWAQILQAIMAMLTTCGL